MKHGLRFFYLIILFFCLGCAATQPPPICIEDRVNCAIVSLKDLTNSYSTMVPTFETVFLKKLKQDYATHFIKGPTAAYNKTAVYTNVFRASENYHYASIDSLKQDNRIEIYLTGYVEEISYGAPERIEGYLFHYGLLGLDRFSGKIVRDKETRAAFLEYHLEAYTVEDDKLLVSCHTNNAG